MSGSRIAGILVVLILLTLIPLPPGGLRASQLSRMADLPVSVDVWPLYRGGNGTARYLLFSHDIRHGESEPVLVTAADRVITYIDLKSMRVIRRREYDSNEWAVVSSNGKFIAVKSNFENRRTGKIIRKVRIEDWEGEVLWEMGAGMRSFFEPTPTGGFAAYPSANPDMFTDVSELDARLVPEPRPHGLLIYDAHGELILEDLDPRDFLGGYDGVLSPDGRYLAFGYGVRPARSKGTSAASLRDSSELILYDVERGTELWRKHFNCRSIGSIFVGPGAERLLCFLSKGRLLSDYSRSMLLLDRAGHLLAERQVGNLGTPTHVSEPVASCDGRFCVFITKDSKAYLIRLEDGEELWRMERPPGAHGIGCLQVTDDGGALMVATSKANEPGEYERELIRLNSDGEAIARFDGADIRSGGSVYAGRISPDGRSLWLVQDSALVHYALEGVSR
ncbi:MAG: hypothetical protein JRJ47_09220 [Deltaproteobacteria bacterium]|nr:hypothetical protein [Deltaproteobacteria bacterium]